MWMIATDKFRPGQWVRHLKTGTKMMIMDARQSYMTAEGLKWSYRVRPQDFNDIEWVVEQIEVEATE